jgi:hypothetical protein
MKRSEMLLKIQEMVVNKWDIPWNDFAGEPEDNLLEFANDLLTVVESNGMSPPAVSGEEWYKRGRFDEWVARAEEYYGVFEWEPEDDQK